MSTIAAGTTTNTALVSTGDTSGQLVFQTNGTTTALTIGTNQVVTLAQPLPVASGGTGGTSTTFCNLATNVTGTLPIANGGTGSTSTAYCSLTTNVTGTLPIANGGTGATSLAAANIPATNAVNTFTGTQSFTGTSSALAVVLNDAAEVVTVTATAATGTINYDVTTQSVLFYTTNASANFVVNFRASSGTSLNTALSTGQSVTVAFLVTNGTTAYYNTSVQVDGTTSGVTTRWQGGTAPSSGNASSVDIYSYTIIKTGNAAFSVFAAQTRFA